MNKNEFDTHCLPAFFLFRGIGLGTGRIGLQYGVLLFMVGIILEIYASFFETVQKYLCDETSLSAACTITS
jgi:hypothetical protein